MLSRREWLLGLSGAGLALSAPQRQFSFGCQTNAWPVNPADRDTLFSAIHKIGELGYSGFETGFRNLQVAKEQLAEVKQRIADSGLTFYGIHIFLGKYDEQSHIAPHALYEAVGQIGAALGAQRLILSGGAAAAAADLARKSAALNQAGAFAKGLGLSLAYHNHWPEFDNGGREIHALLQDTDPSLVGFLLDAGHAFRIGADVPAFVAANHARLVGLHLRDFAAKKQVPLGQGEFPLQQVAAALKHVNWQGWALAEEEREDGSKPGEAAAGPALAALRRAFGA
jgi:sugar phosphate isomerase/epimerase